MMKMYKSVEDHITSFPPEVQKRLRKIQSLIRQEAPEATEVISYGIPTFKLNGNLVHYAGYPNHIGFYGIPSTMDQFETQLAQYRTGQGTLQFKHDEPIPYDLLKDLVKERVRIAKDKKK
jgi:uncharacterized protein YdhG (YjbR/CyaY superfamily)